MLSKISMLNLSPRGVGCHSEDPSGDKTGWGYAAILISDTI